MISKIEMNHIEDLFELSGFYRKDQKRSLNPMLLKLLDCNLGRGCQACIYGENQMEWIPILIAFLIFSDNQVSAARNKFILKSGNSAKL